MKKVIGVMPLWDEEKKSIWMLPGYFDGLREAGAVPLMFPFLEDEEDIRHLCGLCDGFLFTGGQDVSPQVWKWRRGPAVPEPDGDSGRGPAVPEMGEGSGTLQFCEKEAARAGLTAGSCEEAAVDPVDRMTIQRGEIAEGLSLSCPQRDRMEGAVLSYVMESGKPALGICRGHQFINAALGGTLYEDLPLQHPSTADHNMKPPYDRVAHKVTVLERTPLAGLLGSGELGVNSSHHQAVRETAPCLRPMAVSEDGLVEAVFHPDHPFLWGVQWHPEFFFRRDEASRKILRAFTEAAGGDFCPQGGTS